MGRGMRRGEVLGKNDDPQKELKFNGVYRRPTLPICSGSTVVMIVQNDRGRREIPTPRAGAGRESRHRPIIPPG